MEKVLRAEDARYREVVERSTRKYVRDQSLLSEEIVSLLDMHGELACSKLALMAGADNRLVQQVLLDLAKEGRVTGMQRMGSRGQSHCFWSVADCANRHRVQFNGSTILSAFQRSAADRWGT